MFNLSGSAAGMINTTAYSFSSLAYPDNVDRIVSLIEGIVGIGYTISPVMGVFIYGAVGFADTFYIFGSALAPCALFIFCLPDPRDLNNKNALKKSHDNQTE